MDARLKDNIEREHAHLDAIESAGEMIPELSKVFSVGACVPTRSITASCPFDPELIKEHEAALTAADWTFVREYEATESANLVREFVLDTVDLVLFYEPNITGATCKRNLVGHVEVPVYERVCVEA